MNGETHHRDLPVKVVELQITIPFRPDDRPGEWMYHCHILEHHERGMMGHFTVVR
jgi:FtsP/CotA-like multicopper oxidase with cupredoxin domain